MKVNKINAIETLTRNGTSNIQDQTTDRPMLTETPSALNEISMVDIDHEVVTKSE